MTIAEFKQLLNIPVEASQEAIRSRFALLAEALFRDFQIEKGGEVYDFLEIEFYFWNAVHQDEITYRRQCPAGMWYFHSSGVDISFASDSNRYGGILLRSVVRVASEPEIIAGPLRLVDHLFDYWDMTGDETFFQPRLVLKSQPDASCLIETTPRKIANPKQSQFFAAPYCYYVRSRHNCDQDWKNVDSFGRSQYYKDKPWSRKRKTI